jgi:protein TonB
VPNISDWNPGGAGEFVTTNDYFGMVRLKIESCKTYPESAKSRHMEGRVKVQFVITTDGNISSLKVVQHAGHASLSTAALNAVKKAAPFPRPPPGLLKCPLHMEITILFELT